MNTQPLNQTEAQAHVFANGSLTVEPTLEVVASGPVASLIAQYPAIWSLLTAHWKQGRLHVSDIEGLIAYVKDNKLAYGPETSS